MGNGFPKALLRNDRPCTSEWKNAPTATKRTVDNLGTPWPEKGTAPRQVTLPEAQLVSERRTSSTAQNDKHGTQSVWGLVVGFANLISTGFGRALLGGAVPVCGCKRGMRSPVEQ